MLNIHPKCQGVLTQIQSDKIKKTTIFISTFLLSIYVLLNFFISSSLKHPVHILSTVKLNSLRSVTGMCSNNLGFPHPRYSINLSLKILCIIKVNILKKIHSSSTCFLIPMWHTGLQAYLSKKERAWLGPPGSDWYQYFLQQCHQQVRSDSVKWWINSA
jgi:hypothetical protein